MEEIEQESQRGLHLDYFNLFNVWLHRLKNKINKTPGEKTFWFECEKQEEMPTPPLSRGDFPEANVLPDSSRRGGRGDMQGLPQPLVSKLKSSEEQFGIHRRSAESPTALPNHSVLVSLDNLHSCDFSFLPFSVIDIRVFYYKPIA